MNVIKTGSLLARQARPFSVTHHYADLPFVPEAGMALPADCADPDPLEAALERIALLENAIADQKAAAIAERNAAEARGYDRGKSEHDKLEAERLVLLRASMNDALAKVAEAVDASGTIAVDIARTALARLFADPAHYQRMVAETARLWSRQLAAGTTVRLRVSQIDFPDQEALDLLVALSSRVEVECDPALEAGACLFDLTLGRLDASIPRQAAAVDDLLQRAALFEGAAS